MKQILTFLTFLISLVVSAQTIDRQVFSPSGGYDANSAIKLSWTIGEPLVQTIQNSNVKLLQGFQQPTVNPPQDTIVIVNQPVNSVVCSGADIAFTVTATAAVNFQWYEYNGTQWTQLANIGLYSGTTQTSLNVSGVTQAMNGYKYKCAVWNVNYSDTTNEVVLTVNPLPIVFIGNDTSLCGSNSYTLNAGNIGLNYHWSNSETSQTISVNSTGLYGVTVTSPNGCWSRDVIYLVFNPNPIVNLGNDTSFCNNNFHVLHAGIAGLTYLWNDNSTNESISVNNSGNYSVTVTNDYGCSDGDSINVTMYPLPIVNLGSNQGLCEGTTALPDAGNEGSTFLWNIGSISQSIIVTSSGNYSVTVTSPYGCTATDNVIIMVRPKPVVHLGNDISICANDSLLLDAGNSGSTYHWSNNSTSQTIHPNTTGDYIVTVTNIYQCSATDTVHVIVKQSGSISGTAVYSGGFIGADQAKAMLFVSGSHGNGNAFKEVNIGNNGSFNFIDVSPNNYLLYVKLNEHSNYQHVQNSYYDITYKWQNAQIITLQCGQSKTVTINMYENGPSDQGVHTLSGNIHYRDTSKDKSMGEPVPGAEIFVELEPDDEPIANTNADTSGFWFVNHIPDGTVSIYVDIPGLPMGLTFTVTLSAQNQNYDNLNFLVDTLKSDSAIYKDPVNSIRYPNSLDFSAEIYPNPFSDFIEISYAIKEESYVNIELFDLNGKKVSIIENRLRPQGEFKNNLSAKTLGLIPAVYYLKIQVNNSIYLKKIVLFE